MLAVQLCSAICSTVTQMYTGSVLSVNGPEVLQMTSPVLA